MGLFRSSSDRACCWGQQPGTSQELLSSVLMGNHWSSVASIYQADIISSNSCQVLFLLECPKITASLGGERAFPSPGRDAICTQFLTKPLTSSGRGSWLLSITCSLLLTNNMYSGQQCLQLKNDYSQLSLGLEGTMYLGSGQ